MDFLYFENRRDKIPFSCFPALNFRQHRYTTRGGSLEKWKCHFVDLRVIGLNSVAICFTDTLRLQKKERPRISNFCEGFPLYEEKGLENRDTEKLFMISVWFK